MEFMDGRAIMNDYVFATMMTENTLLKRDICERDARINQLEHDIKEKEKLIEKLWEMIQGGNK